MSLKRPSNRPNGSHRPENYKKSKSLPKNLSKRQLIAEAHSLHPIVIIGNRGLTRTVLLEIDRALNDHELIKIRIPAMEKVEKQALIETIGTELQAECLRTIGHIIILYRENTV